MPALPSKVQKIVVLMLENRSFDHMLGALPGVEGVLDAAGKVRTDIYNRVDPSDASSKAYAPRLGSVYVTPSAQVGTYGGGPSHTFPSATQQLFSVETVGTGATETTPYAGGAPKTDPPTNSGFVVSFIGELTQDMGEAALAAARAAAANGQGEDPVQEVMDVFTPDQLPALSTLAQEFAVCDHWFSELPGPTEPNRLFTHAGTSTGLTYNPWALDTLTVDTLYDRLNDAKKSWGFYANDLSDGSNFDSLVKDPRSDLPFAQFFTDAAAGTLPFYSFLCPLYGTAQANSQHAPHDVRYGEKLIADVYAAVRSSPDWPNILLVVTYDEHGGYHDHVQPPTVAAPDAAVSPNPFMVAEGAYFTGPNYHFAFTSLGFRVPAVVVSPYIPKGTIDATPYRHTSILRFVEDLIGRPPLTQRDATANSFASLLSLATARTDCPLTLPVPPLPSAVPTSDLAPSTPKQRELANRYLAKLPGHPDTGRPISADIRTHARWAAYTERRRQSARWARAGEHEAAEFQVYLDVEARWRWRLRTRGGNIVAVSPDSWQSEQKAQRALELVRFLSHMLP